MGERIEEELRTFRHFVQVARLPVVPESIEKRYPPEPDMRCRLSHGEEVAFELVEICNPVNARFSGSVDHIYGLAMSAYRSLSPSARKAFDDRFINVPLSFSFRPAASLSAIRNALPSLLGDLVSAPKGDGGYKGLSPAARAVGLSIRNVGRADNPGNVNFNIGTSFDPTVSLKAVAAKLSKKYESDSPIELLAYFGAHAWGHDTSYRDVLSQIVEVTGVGPFRRIWVLEWNGIAVEFLSMPHLGKEQTGKTSPCL